MKDQIVVSRANALPLLELRTRRAWSALWLCVLIGALPCRLASAQESNYGAWVRNRVATGAPPASVQRVSGPLALTVLPFAGQAHALAPERLRDPLIACAGLLRYPRDSVESIVTERAVPEADASEQSRPTVAIVVSLRGTEPETCVPRSRDANLALMAAGVDLSRDGPPRGVRILGVRVRVNGAVVEPVGTSVGFVRRFSRDGEEQVHAARVRVHLEPELFAPLASGSAPRVAIEVELTGDATPRVVELTAAEVDTIWRSGLEWFVTRLDRQPALENAHVPLPRPSDRRLREAREDIRLGRLLEGSRATAHRLDALPRLSKNDALSARVQLGVLWSAVGDTLAARAVLADVARAEPCLTLVTATPSLARAIIDDVRPPADCEPPNLGLTIRRSLVPGGGQRVGSGNRRSAGLVILGAVAVSAGYGAASGLRSSSLYDRYETDTRDPSGTWRAAERARAAANTALASAVALWGLSALESAWWAYRTRARLEDRREYGSRATSSFGPLDASRGAR